MIVYVFNQPFPDNSGFGRRCQREIEALSTKEFVTVVCRHQLGEPMEEEVSLAGHLVKLVRFSAKSEVVHRPENYTGNGLYEIKRNLDLLANLCKTLARVLKHYPRKEVKLYCVTSPLTVPLIVLFFAYFFRVKPSLVSFHDLEPELAMHLKNLPSNHWIVKVELFLESFVCKFFNKILVTTDSQAERLSTRTHQPLSKFCSIVNTTYVAKN